MTWSVTHTINCNSLADNHTAMVYLFDTVLAGKTGWTISAHPSASAFRRRAKFTVNNKVTNSNYTMYSWVDWGSTTSTQQLYWNEDSVYTTTPGDTATNTTTSYYNWSNWSTFGEHWKFCTSSENSQSVLVLKGGKVAFYWPGINTGIFWPDSTWAAGSTQNKGTWIGPAIGYVYDSLMVTNSPVSGNTETNEFMMLPDAGFTYNASSGGFRLEGNYIATNFNWMYTQQQTGAQLDYSSHTAFSNGGHTDTGVWLPSSMTSTSANRMPFNYSSNGITMQVGSNYWYNPHTDLGRQAVVFNFGAVDPLA